MVISDRSMIGERAPIGSSDGSRVVDNVYLGGPWWMAALF